MIHFENTYSQLPGQFYRPVMPSSAKAPHLIHFNRALAEELNLSLADQSSANLAQIFSGQKILESCRPGALAYAGHQFGHFVPQLGDGRAILLGEVLSRNHQRFDVQLKGAGRTPFSRGGDGRSALGPVLREYLLSEAMHQLHIPTTRALAAVTTGENVQRDEYLPGAIFTRISRGHVRVGSFEYFSAQNNLPALKALADYSLKRFFPNLQAIKKDDERYLCFFRKIAEQKLSLVAKWMGVGFIHGVMNTDNTSICGETLDYGPCAFMDNFVANKVFSSIDRFGRYAYNRQGDIALWNLSSLAHCLSPLIAADPCELEKLFQAEFAGLESFYQQCWREEMGHKLGIYDPLPEDEILINQWLHLLEANQLDFTNSFTHLNQALESENFHFCPLDPENLQHFMHHWSERLECQEAQQDKTKHMALKLMKKSNPVIIPRNHQVQKAILLAQRGDYQHFKDLNKALATPYDPCEKNDPFNKAPTPQEIVHHTFCGT